LINSTLGWETDLEGSKARAGRQSGNRQAGFLADDTLKQVGIGQRASDDGFETAWAEGLG